MMPVKVRNWLSWSRRHWRRLLVLVFASILPMLWFAEIAEDLVEHEGFFYDAPILQALHAFSSDGYDALARSISLIGLRWGTVPLDIAVFVFLLARRQSMHARYWAVAVGGAAVLNVVAKHAFARTRPNLWQSIAPENTFSFPSGHAMGSMAAMAALVVLLWPTRWRYPMLIFAATFVVAVGLSRMYLGVHYPSDVLAGWAASLGWVIGVSALMWGRLSAEDGDGRKFVDTADGQGRRGR
jgi:undecaprenyl-diphosphatase